MPKLTEFEQLFFYEPDGNLERANFSANFPPKNITTHQVFDDRNL